MNTMHYNGYDARVEFDADDRIFVGHIAGIRDIVGFHGGSVDAPQGRTSRAGLSRMSRASTQLTCP